ncbi:MAG: efflux RND transporter periplasmic adaptor subunit [Saprospiraceae bacterium]|nr:efflux RND transporter periplasmic adaptor subunit [Saprospiraceae bacterium]MBP7699596.1 efflux RND transporter periplasmic adaptor subunit [Saprospiraceae bacterium]
MRINIFNLTASALIILTVLNACGGDPNSLDAKKAELSKYKTQQKELLSKISTLEKEIATLDKSEVNKVIKPKLVAVDTLRTANFVNYIDVMGKVDADENTTISPTTGGTVTNVLVKVGQHVTTGQTLATVDDGILTKSIAQLEQQLTFATDLYNRQQRLWDQKIGSEVQLLQAKNGKEAIEKQIETVKEQMRMMRIKAPFSGVVDEVMLKKGQLAAPGYPAFRIMNNQGLKVKADVAESYIGKIKTGNRVKLFFPDLKKETDATLNYVSQVIDPMNRTFKAEIKLPNNKEYHPNMLVVVKIIDFSTNNTIVVPVNTIQKAEEGNYLFVAREENGKQVARRVWIEKGLTYNGRTHIKKGLKNGDALIITGYQDLNEGDLITY